MDRNSPFGGHKQNLVYTRIQEKGAVIPQEAEPYLLVCARESQVEACVDRVLLWDQGTAYNSPGISPFEGGCHYYHYPYYS